MTWCAPTTWVMIGYASNERQANITSSPGAQNAWMSCWHSDTEPQPIATWSWLTPYFDASRSTSANAPMSG